MAGDPTKTAIWTGADVYVAPLGTAKPASVTAPFGAGWGLVGLLDGDDGMPESRDEDTDDKYAWGVGIVRTSRKNFKLTKKFSALEDNATTRSLIWPGSSDSVVVVPRPVPVMVAFEVRDASTGKVERKISRNYALITVDGDVDQNESDLTNVTLAAVIYPDASTVPVLFDRQAAPTITALALSVSTLALTTGAIKNLTATATYSDASTSDVTAAAAWSSATPAKATVAYGYVTGVAAGTSNVTAAYGGLTSAACAVTVS